MICITQPIEYLARKSFKYIDTESNLSYMYVNIILTGKF